MATTGAMSNTLENAVLDLILGKQTTTLTTASTSVLNPSTLFVVLYSTAVDIDDTFTSTSTGQCAGSTYTRDLGKITNSSTQWAAASGGSKTNNKTITITTGAGTDWGTIQSFAILNTSSTASGSILYYSTITGGNKTINSGDTVQFSTGGIVVTQT